ncbi:MAG: type IV conjugative transfer system protein TraE [Candidatus Paracaedibacteraceae bacterium]|nr:type IV conjugative transfer system protein TraE [Candidatus Paracaedibacteraceae bacterium]
MNFKFAQKSLDGLGTEKKLILYVATGLSLSNLALGLALIFKSETTILIPEFNTDHRIHMRGGEFDDQYFIDWADGIVKTALTVNPESVEWRHNEVLKISTHSYGNMKQTLKENAERIKNNNISTVFYPKTFEVNQSQKYVRIQGQNLAFIGKDARPVIQDKTYDIYWIKGAHGIVLLKDLIEIGSGGNHA